MIGVLWTVYLVFWIGGVGSHVLHGGAPPEMAWAAPLFLVLAGAIAIASDVGEWRVLLAAAAIGFVAEMAGVRWGYPFGRYQYTAALAPAIANVPLAIAAAWMVVFAYVRQMRLNLWLSAACMAALDLVIDPLAANFLGYWRWITPGPYYGVPLINFAGWVLIGLIIFAVLPGASRENRSTMWLGTSILLFFAAIAAVHRFFLPAALGVAFSGAGYFRFRSSSVSTII